MSGDAEITLAGSIKDLNKENNLNANTGFTFRLVHIAYILATVAIFLFGIYQGNLNQKLNAKLDRSEYRETYKTDSLLQGEWRKKMEKADEEQQKQNQELKHNLKKLFRVKYGMDYEDVGPDGRFETIENK